MVRKEGKPLWEQQSSTAWNFCTSIKLGSLLSVSVHTGMVFLFFTFEKSMEAFFSSKQYFIFNHF